MTATAVYEQLTLAIELELLDAAREATALEAGLRHRRGAAPTENGPARLSARACFSGTTARIAEAGGGAVSGGGSSRCGACGAQAEHTQPRWVTLVALRPELAGAQVDDPTTPSYRTRRRG